MSAKTKTTAPDCPLDDIVTHLKRFLVMPTEHHFTILATWVVHTYAFDAAYATPYLYVNSAEPESGKSRVLEVLHDIVRNPIMASSVSPSVIYRDIEASSPTLFIDEVDAIFRGGTANEDLRNILNSGYKSTTGWVRRTVPGADGGEVKPFRTFAPKALAGIDNAALPETIGTRSISLNLKRKKDSEIVERYLSRRVEADCAALRDRIDVWVRHNMDHFVTFDAPIIDELGDRAFEIVEPLLAIASRCKGWTAKTRDAAKAMLIREKPMTEGAKILLAAHTLFTELNADRLTTAALAEATDLNGKALGVKLAPYGIKPTTIRFGGGKVAKGYHRRDFDDAFERYLPQS